MMNTNMNLYNKSDNKTTKIIKIMVACIPSSVAETELFKRGKTKLQLKNGKLIKSGILKILFENVKIKDAEARRIANGSMLEPIMSEFLLKYNKRGIVVPSFEEANRFFLSITEDICGKIDGLKIEDTFTSTPKKPALARTQPKIELQTHQDTTTQTSFPTFESTIDSTADSTVEDESCFSTMLPPSQATEQLSYSILNDARNYARTDSESMETTWETVSQ